MSLCNVDISLIHCVIVLKKKNKVLKLLKTELQKTPDIQSCKTHGFCYNKRSTTLLNFK